MFQVKKDGIILTVTTADSKVLVTPVLTRPVFQKGLVSVARSEELLAQQYINAARYENVTAALLVYFDNRGWTIMEDKL